MPSATFNKLAFIVFLLTFTLGGFNLFHWAQPPSVLSEVGPRSHRGPASVEGKGRYSKLRNNHIIAYDCSNPQEIHTAKKEIRIHLINCSELSKNSSVYNRSNYFQATLFAEKDSLITDYVPLLAQANQIEAEGKANIVHKIVVNRTSVDAE